MALLSTRLPQNALALKISHTSITIKPALLAILNGMRLVIPALCASWELFGKHQTRLVLKDAHIPWSTMSASAPLPLQCSTKLPNNASPAIRKNQFGTAKSAKPAQQVLATLLLLATVSAALRELSSTKKSKSVSLLDLVTLYVIKRYSYTLNQGIWSIIKERSLKWSTTSLKKWILMRL